MNCTICGREVCRTENSMYFQYHCTYCGDELNDATIIISGTMPRNIIYHYRIPFIKNNKTYLLFGSNLDVISKTQLFYVPLFPKNKQLLLDLPYRKIIINNHFISKLCNRLYNLYIFNNSK